MLIASSMSFHDFRSSSCVQSPPCSYVAMARACVLLKSNNANKWCSFSLTLLHLGTSPVAHIACHVMLFLISVYTRGAPQSIGRHITNRQDLHHNRGLDRGVGCLRARERPKMMVGFCGSERKRRIRVRAHDSERPRRRAYSAMESSGNTRHNARKAERSAIGHGVHKKQWHHYLLTAVGKHQKGYRQSNLNQEI